ncbi:MAG: bifunctional transcriptional activator/DNA repair protein Ada [Hellea sp.]|nr:bifunctional transcriptional activator/DNA repair protein Ada [Hellea sp.]
MLDDTTKYEIFRNRDETYSGQFYMGVRSTGIFCRPGCPARTPKAENCLFFQNAEGALKAGYRPCKRCHPMNMPGEASALIKKLINLVESDPERRWSEKDLLANGVDPSTARRQFKSRFGMTFSAYVRQCNLAKARQCLAQGDSVIEAQLCAGFDSPSGFRVAFAKTFGQSPKDVKISPLLIDWIDTPLGTMVTICDEQEVYLAEFTVRKNLQGQLEKLTTAYKRPILPGRNDITMLVETQIKSYFHGSLKSFDLPIKTTGTDFQNGVWQALCDIPYGQTRSYAQLATAIGNDKAFRAVASSNARNGLAIIIPCHRVINKGGALGGYAGGLDKKRWLLDHEARVSKSSNRAAAP